MPSDDFKPQQERLTSSVEAPTIEKSSAGSEGQGAHLSEVGANLVLEKLQPIVAASKSVVGGVQIVAIFFSIAAAGLVTLLILSFNDITIWKVALAVVIGFGLLIPAATWWLLRAGLQAVIDLPGQLVKLAGKGRTQISSGVTGAVGGTRRGFLSMVTSVLKSLLDLKSTGLEGKLLVVESVALLRMFNPFTLILALVTFAAGSLEIVILLVIGFIQLVI